jgi:hypothetical protein
VERRKPVALLERKKQLPLYQPQQLEKFVHSEQAE